MNLGGTVQPITGGVSQGSKMEEKQEKLEASVGTTLGRRAGHQHPCRMWTGSQAGAVPWPAHVSCRRPDPVPSVWSFLSVGAAGTVSLSCSSAGRAVWQNCGAGSLCARWVLGPPALAAGLVARATPGGGSLAMPAARLPAWWHQPALVLTAYGKRR